MPVDISGIFPLLIPAAVGALSAFSALTLVQARPFSPVKRLLVCVLFGAVSGVVFGAQAGVATGITDSTGIDMTSDAAAGAQADVTSDVILSGLSMPALSGGQRLILTVLLFLFFGLAVWLMIRLSALYTAMAAILAALMTGTLSLLLAAGWFIALPVTAILTILCCWQRITIFPASPEILVSADKQQSRKFFSSTAMVLLILLLSTLWVWYQLLVFAPSLSAEFQMMTLFTAAMVLTILIILRQLAFDAVQRIEALIDKQYQTELLNLMQIIRSQRHDFNFHVQAISGMIEQGKYAECDEYIHSMVRTATIMNDMLPLHDPAVSAMINSFREMASQKKIELQVAISNDLAQLPLSTYETNTIIGNLLQNAIDELDQNRELRPWISLLILKRGGNHTIKVTNPCHQTEDAFRSCFNPGFTTKQTHEGIGLTTVMRLVTRYHGVVFTEYDSGVISFVVQIPGAFQ